MNRIRLLKQISRLLGIIFIIFCLVLIIDIYFNDAYMHIDPGYANIPFWQDNRTYQTGRTPPQPSIDLDKIDLSNFTVAIVGCCRNVEENLRGFRANIRAIGKLFKKYRIYLGESDSTDRTVEFIKKWAREEPDRVDLFAAGNLHHKIIFRTQRLAICRNTVLERARRTMPDMDYFFVVDIDLTSKAGFNTTNFLSNFMYPTSTWAVMTGSHTQYYHDVWALRSTPRITVDFRVRMRSLSYLGFEYPWIHTRLNRIHNKGIPLDHPLIEVDSAFGAAAIYNAKYIGDECRYDGFRKTGFWFFREQCEHVSFNLCVLKHAGPGKFFINPKFQVFW